MLLQIRRLTVLELHVIFIELDSIMGTVEVRWPHFVKADLSTFSPQHAIKGEGLDDGGPQSFNCHAASGLTT